MYIIFRSYLPDLPWDRETVGYPISWVHWMFRQALKSQLLKRLSPIEYKQACIVFRKFFNDPRFGLPEYTDFPKLIKHIMEVDPCDCNATENIYEINEDREMSLDLESETSTLLKSPKFSISSHICKLATEDIPCETLKVEREKAMKRQEAAITIQSYWRKYWVKKYLNSKNVFNSELLKAV